MRGEKIQWNPDTQGITVSTDSTVGSNEWVSVYFYDKNGNYAGGVWIYFSTEIQNNLRWYKNYTPFSVTLSVPVEGQRIWTFTYYYTDLSVVIHCNQVEVLNVLLFDSVCTVCPVPVEGQRIWTIAYNSVELMVVIHCNEVQSNEYVYFYNQDGNYTESVYIHTQIMYGILFPWNPDTQNISVSTDSLAGSGEVVHCRKL